MVSIEQNIATIQDNITNAAAKRRYILPTATQAVKLIAVTKNHTVTEIRSALNTGVITAIGENRVQEAMEKYEQLPSNLEWHLIGHLQSNKVRQAVKMFDLIHSVDSEKLMLEIERAAANINKVQDVLIQINVVGEATKFGIAPEELASLLEKMQPLQHVRLCGLMTIAPFYDNNEELRPIFQKMYQLFTDLKKANLPYAKPDWLSMGMTNDYTVAIEEGANLVRVGTGIFGPRVYKT